MKLYETMGTLAHEHRPVYTLCAISELSEPIEIILPDGWTETENINGEPMIEAPNGKLYTVNDIVRCWGTKPALQWYDDAVEHHIILTKK